MNRGFTLIEVLVALAVFAIGLVGLLKVNAQTTVEIEQLKRQTLATYAADYYLAKRQTETLTAAELQEFEIDIGGIEWEIQLSDSELSLTSSLPMSVLEVISTDGDTFYFDVFLP